MQIQNSQSYRRYFTSIPRVKGRLGVNFCHLFRTVKRLLFLQFKSMIMNNFQCYRMGCPGIWGQRSSRGHYGWNDLFEGQKNKKLLLSQIELDYHDSWSVLSGTNATYGVFRDLRSKVSYGSILVICSEWSSGFSSYRSNWIITKVGQYYRALMLHATGIWIIGRLGVNLAKMVILRVKCTECSSHRLHRMIMIVGQ